MSAFRITVPRIVAGLLIVTAALKGVVTIETSATQTAQHIPHWVVVAVVQAELVVAFLLLSGRRPQLAWKSATVLFLLFATFSLYRAVTGYGSCGCFGPLPVNPWWTFTLDLGILSLLLSQRRTFVQPLLSPARSILSCGMAGYAAFTGLSLLLMVSPDPTVIRAGESVGGEDKFVVLKPTEWLERKFPLADHISPRLDVINDDWIVLVYHHDCPKCRDALPRYERLAGDIYDREDKAHVLLLEVAPFGETAPRGGPAQRARLSNDREWFVQTPIEIQLHNGKVKLVSLELPSLTKYP